jgi:hypothetical protein
MPAKPGGIVCIARHGSIIRSDTDSIQRQSINGTNPAVTG